MVIPSLLIKGSLVTLGAGIIGSAVAVPITLLNSQSQIIIENFPTDKKSEYQDKCQILTKDESIEKREKDRGYLLICDDSGNYEATFYYYYSGGEREKITELEGKKTVKEGDQITVVVKLAEEVEANLTATNGDWTDLIGKKLSNCALTKSDDGEKRWSVKCPKEDSSDSTGIFLTPIN